MIEMPPTFSMLRKLVVVWANARNIIDGSNPKDQLHKLYQEVGELSDDICKGKDPRLEMGDVLVMTIVLCAQLGTLPEECLEMAYNKIKDRKGMMLNGVFIKAEDL